MPCICKYFFICKWYWGKLSRYLFLIPSQLWNFGVVEVNAKDTSCFWLNQLQENCADFPEGVFDKIHDERIVGGIEADIGEIQWQANLAYKDELDQFCGGTLLCDRFVLTAAHCVEYEAPDNIVVILGDHNKENENDPYEITNDVKKIILHPKYVPETSNDNSYNDIALLQLSKPVRNKKGIRSACLPKYEPIDPRYPDMLITGWGRVRPSGPYSEVLLKAKVDLIPRNKCKEMYGKDGGNVTERMICASSPGKDTCQGDSGGILWFPLSLFKIPS